MTKGTPNPYTLQVTLGEYDLPNFLQGLEREQTLHIVLTYSRNIHKKTQDGTSSDIHQSQSSLFLNTLFTKTQSSRAPTNHRKSSFDETLLQSSRSIVDHSMDGSNTLLSMSMPSNLWHTLEKNDSGTNTSEEISIGKCKHKPSLIHRIRKPFSRVWYNFLNIKRHGMLKNRHSTSKVRLKIDEDSDIDSKDENEREGVFELMKILISVLSRQPAPIRKKNQSQSVKSSIPEELTELSIGVIFELFVCVQQKLDGSKEDICTSWLVGVVEDIGAEDMINDMVSQVLELTKPTSNGNNCVEVSCLLPLQVLKLYQHYYILAVILENSSQLAEYIHSNYLSEFKYLVQVPVLKQRLSTHCPLSNTVLQLIMKVLQKIVY
ncbi:Hypothetical predicted protein [Octopus vulgaris]|uniref:Uncharacterized protein n=1 Tax=Octopus vulgaris TaxID=6645 RepID=A0AA36BTI7_OCTVU|nr:Hypothetical predicted protein [Octopus vulgaris]